MRESAQDLRKSVQKIDSAIKLPMQCWVFAISYVARVAAEDHLSLHNRLNMLEV
jgi:hypothetical protein